MGLRRDPATYFDFILPLVVGTMTLFKVSKIKIDKFKMAKSNLRWYNRT